MLSRDNYPICRQDADCPTFSVLMSRTRRRITAFQSLAPDHSMVIGEAVTVTAA